MIIGVKRNNFVIYALCLLLGIVLIVIAIILYVMCPETIADEITLSIGCSTIPTVLTTYFIDFAAEKRERKRINELRCHFLRGMPHGLFWIMKAIIERYYPEPESNDKSFLLCFNIAIENMENTDFNRLDIREIVKEREQLLENIGYGIRLCNRDCGSILDHYYELEINEIFSQDELSAIQYLYEECNGSIIESPVLNETAEYIKIAVNNTIEKICELKEKSCNIAFISKRLVKNWHDIAK